MEDKIELLEKPAAGRSDLDFVQIPPLKIYKMFGRGICMEL